jgi:hypothetical protein
MFSFKINECAAAAAVGPVVEEKRTMAFEMCLAIFSPKL